LSQKQQITLKPYQQHPTKIIKTPHQLKMPLLKTTVITITITSITTIITIIITTIVNQTTTTTATKVATKVATKIRMILPMMIKLFLSSVQMILLGVYYGLDMIA
jgi:hypothetical protein